jgi:hypothetical protein
MWHLDIPHNHLTYTRNISTPPIDFPLGPFECPLLLQGPALGTTEVPPGTEDLLPFLEFVYVGWYHSDWFLMLSLLTLCPGFAFHLKQLFRGWRLKRTTLVVIFLSSWFTICIFGTGRVAQVVESLSSKWEALSSPQYCWKKIAISIFDILIYLRTLRLNQIVYLVCRVEECQNISPVTLAFCIF